MTFKIPLEWENNVSEHVVWNRWCREHLLNANGSITWAWISGRNGREEGILFATDEDAIAFRLKFGI